MNITDIANNVNKLGSAWREFKDTNDRRLKEIEKNGHSDPLLNEKLHKINFALDDYKERLTSVETTMLRPQMGDQYKNFDQKNSEYKNAFNSYLRKGIEKNLVELEKKSLSLSSEPDGGYLVTKQMNTNLVQTIQERSVIRQLASVETISTDSLELVEDMGEAEAKWVAEVGPVNETKAPQLGKKKIPVHELYAQPKATQKLIDDSSIDIEGWLNQKLAITFAHRENESFINGDGIGKPRGILSYPAGNSWGKIEQLTSSLIKSVSADDLLKLYFSLKEVYTVNGVFLMHRSMLQEIRMLKDKTSGRYLWNPGLALADPSTLMGVPVHCAQEMPAVESGKLAIVFADLANGYKIVDRRGIRVLRDPFTDKPFVKFYTTKRVGGDVVNYDAIKIMKLGTAA